MDLLTLLTTAYFTFGAGLVVGVYLADDPGDRPEVEEQVATVAAALLVWPLLLLFQAYAMWRNR
jgi:hypothetical protein